MSLGSGQCGNLKKYASRKRNEILNLVRLGGFEMEATAMFHQLEGVRAAAFLLGDDEADSFISGILRELEALDGGHELG